jgi:hypothetical protein
MNDSCREMKNTIEGSIGRSLSDDERNKLEEHCAVCDSCRRYRDRLLEDDSRLAGFASSHSRSEQRVERRAIELLSAGAPMRTRGGRFHRAFARIPRIVRIAAAAAAAVAVIAAIDLLRGYHTGTVPAFASVLERVDKAESVIYRYRRWSDGQWITRECADNSNVDRTDYGDSIVVRGAPAAVRTLVLYPAQKRAVVHQIMNPPQIGHEGGGAVERLAGWNRRQKYTFVRRERCEGRMTALYERTAEGAKVKWLVWVDLDTHLPVRMETINSAPGFAADSTYWGLRLSDFLPAGASRSEAAGWTDLRAGEPSIIFDNFRWNAPVDTSYFSLNPPSGYTLTRINEVIPEVAEREREMALDPARRIAKALSLWLFGSGNVFPDDIHYTVDPSKFRRLLIADYDKNGIAGDEYRNALQTASQLRLVSQTIKFLEENGSLHYEGKGCAFGDSTKVICWLQTRKGRPYGIIYADLHVATSKTPPKHPRE